MSYQALARKWRPRNFEQVLGQSHVVQALMNALDNQRVHHAFLFTGTRGVGKTTLARILSKALNCQQGIGSTPCGECDACLGIDEGRFVDLIEVDAASRTRVDDTRELLENVQYTPTLGRYKVYLIDEVHMLSGHSFNALLKTLEEPPEHVKFLLATTDPQKLPMTILSRCIQFNLKALDTGVIAAHLQKVLTDEKINHEPAATLILAHSANGSVRDALSLLDQAIAFSNHSVDCESVRTMLGMIDDHFTQTLLHNIASGDTALALQTISSMAERSVDFHVALDEVMTALHNLALFHVSPEAVEWKGVDTSPLHELSRELDPDWIQLLFQIALVCKRDLDLAPDQRSGFEMAILRMICFSPEVISNKKLAGDDKAATNAPTTEAKTHRASNTDNSLTTDIRNANLSPGASAATPATKKTTDSSSNEVDQILTHAHSVDADDLKGDVIRDVTSTANATINSSDQEAAISSDQRSVKERITAATDDDESLTVSRSQLNDDLCQMDNWAMFVKQAGFTGFQRELVQNLVPLTSNDRQLKFDLDESARHLLNLERIRKLEQKCSKTLKCDVKIQVNIKNCSGSVANSLAKMQEKQRQLRKQQAEQAFTHDQHVLEIVDRFDAKIIHNSIKPGSD